MQGMGSDNNGRLMLPIGDMYPLENFEFNYWFCPTKNRNRNMSLKFFKLSQNFIELLDDKDDYNVIIEVKKKNKEKSFMEHSNILKYRSSYFRKELENIQPDKNNIKTIIKPNISAQTFDVILKFSGVALLRKRLKFPSISFKSIKKGILTFSGEEQHLKSFPQKDSNNIEGNFYLFGGSFSDSNNIEGNFYLFGGSFSDLNDIEGNFNLFRRRATPENLPPKR
ncbi:hypothetical protein Glove_349g80 [Diversispora epigaea]|uniref:BTB domain-containing protein n=1 Tax=Diversispora epigaea TaxID=1348612 RepID=A0A397HDX0_9GLOM|nr:hypothetical protein Glove_349g80 [Diversispora epigaea]